MSSETSRQKRKRGRPPNASNGTTDASQEQSTVAEEYDADADERPKKRGRPKKSLEGNAEAGAVTEESLPAPQPQKKTGKRGAEKTEKTKDIVENGHTEVQSRRKRTERPLHHEAEPRTKGSEPSSRRRKGVSHGKEIEVPEQQEEQEEPQATTKQKRNKKGQEVHSERDEQETEELHDQTAKKVPRRKKGRPSLPIIQEESENPQSNDERYSARNKRGHQSLQDIQASNVQNKSSKSRNTSSQSKKVSNIATEEAPSPSTKGPKRRDRASGKSKRAPTEEGNEQEQEEGENESPDRLRPTEDDAIEEPAQAKKKKRRRSSQNPNGEENDDPPSPEKPYTHVAPHVRRVQQSTIEAKWGPLTEASLSAATSILQLAHPPILQRLSNTQQRREHTSNALRLVTHRITRKIGKGLPFPPASVPGKAPRSGRGTTAGEDGRAAEFDFESVLDAMQALERQLDPALAAVELLTREKEKMEKELEKDYEALRNLENGARAQTRENRSLLKKAHVLAPTPEAIVVKREAKKESNIMFSHNKSGSLAGGIFDNLQEDVDLQALGLQLSSHVDSIKNNLQQTNGLLPQLSRSKASLQDVLIRYLDQGQYEQVLLG